MTERSPAPNLFERIAKAAYEATRAWCEPDGGTPRPPWEQADQARRESVGKGVRLVMEGKTSEQVHEAWRADRVQRGWTGANYGAPRDEGAKTNPYLKPYTELTDSQSASPTCLPRSCIRCITAARSAGTSRP
jgi:hypothetical protein